MYKMQQKIKIIIKIDKHNKQIIIMQMEIKIISIILMAQIIIKMEQMDKIINNCKVEEIQTDQKMVIRRIHKLKVLSKMYNKHQIKEIKVNKTNKPKAKIHKIEMKIVNLIDYDKYLIIFHYLISFKEILMLKDCLGKMKND